MPIEFDLPIETNSIIKVIGVGGGGGNAVNHMYSEGIVGVNFLICNTDAQALEMSTVPAKIQLGSDLLKGLGAGNQPEKGKNATYESIDKIKSALDDGTKMVFITAGMGGGTGTGGAPIIAKAARDEGILTVGIVTTPFEFEGNSRLNQARKGLEELRNNVDTLIVINNDKIRETYGDLGLKAALAKADDVLATAARSIAEIITVPGHINVDFEDVNTVMRSGGVAIMGSSVAGGEDRAMTAVKEAINSPLLNDDSIKGAQDILLNISSGTKPITMDEITLITSHIQKEADYGCNVIWGNCEDENLEDKICVTVIATGFGREPIELERHENSADLMGKRSNEPSQVNNPSAKPGPSEPKEKRTKTVTPLFPNGNDQSEYSPLTDLTNTIETKTTRDGNTFIFDNPVSGPGPEREENTVFRKQEAPEVSVPQVSEEDSLLELQEARKALERKKRLKKMSLKIHDDLNQLEKEPAYKRIDRSLDETDHSSDALSSRYTVDDDKEIRDGNSYLHDNVD